MGGAALIPSSFKEEASELGQKFFRSMETEFAKSPAGQGIFKVIKEDYEPILSKTKQEMLNLAQRGGGTHPASGLTVQAGESANRINSMAQNYSRTTTMGRNDALAAHAYIWAQHTNGPIHAQNLADHMAMYFHGNMTDYAGANVSRLKYNIRMNKDYKDLTKDLDTSAVSSDRGAIEKRLQRYASTILAPAIVIPHLETPLNVVLNTPLTDTIKGLADMMLRGKNGVKQTLLQTGIFADNSLRTWQELQQYRSGTVARVTGSPQIGYILGKAVHQPGFNALRDWTLAFAGTTGYHTAMDMADDFAKTGSTRAKIQLERMGIDPLVVARQGGRLTQDQVEKAVYHFVDNKVFLNMRMNRSYMATANAPMRIGLMFHNYVAAEGRFLKREFSDMLRSKDPMMAVQWLATMGIIFPTAGVLTESLENYARGQDDDLQKRVGNMMFQNGAWNGVESWADAYAHMAGFGVLTSYIRGASRNELSNTLWGPIGNVALRDIQDVGQLALKTGEGKYSDVGEAASSPAAKQIYRDALAQSLPDNLGKIISHRFIPTKTEEKERGGSKLSFRRKSSFKGLKHLSQ